MGNIISYCNKLIDNYNLFNKKNYKCNDNNNNNENNNSIQLQLVNNFDNLGFVEIIF